MRANTLTLNGGSIADSAGNPANLGHGPVNSNPLFGVDTATPSVSGVAITSAVGAQNGILNAGDTVNVTVTMSENTVVNTTGGTPTIELTIGGNNNRVDASYVSGSGTSSLVFAYTIQPGEDDDNGIRMRANQLDLNGGSIADLAGNPANLDYGSVPDNPLFVVDTTTPTLSSSTPAENSDNVPRDTDVVLTFNDDMRAGTGNITLSHDSGIPTPNRSQLQR